MKCKNCSKNLINRQKKYCSNSCQQAYQKSIYITNWLDGKEKGYSGKQYELSAHIRSFLLKEANYSCEKCGFNKKHTDGNYILNINHIDGILTNTSITNLEVLCPNCHAMTYNYGSRNTNSFRVR